MTENRHGQVKIDKKIRRHESNMRKEKPLGIVGKIVLENADQFITKADVYKRQKLYKVNQLLCIITVTILCKGTEEMYKILLFISFKNNQ